MKFPLTGEQRAIQQAVREFARGEFDEDQILEMLRERRFPERLQQKACRLEFVGVCYPESFGGQDCSPLDHVLVIEEWCRRDTSVGVALSLLDTGAELICALGSEDQKRRYLPALVQGKLVSTAVAVDTDLDDECRIEDLRLVPDGDGWRLSGRADYVFNAARADLLVVQCCGPQGQVFALVPRETAGVEVQSMGPKLGLDLLSWDTVDFDRVVLGGNDLLRNQDDRPQERFRMHQLLKTAAMYLGIAQGAYDAALRYSQQREQFRRKISAFQGIRHKLVDMYRELQAARALVYHAAHAFGAGRPGPAPRRGGKLPAEKAALAVSDEALQIHGGSGYMVEMPIEHFYRDARMLQGLGGRVTFQKDAVARVLLGRHAA